MTPVKKSNEEQDTWWQSQTEMIYSLLFFTSPNSGPTMKLIDLSHHRKCHCVTIARLCRRWRWHPTPHSVWGRPRCSRCCLLCPQLGDERGLPSLPGHCRCHTEKEDKRMSISTKIVMFLLLLQKKGKTSKGNRKHCVWAGKGLQFKCCEERQKQSARSASTVAHLVVSWSHQ